MSSQLFVFLLCRRPQFNVVPGATRNKKDERKEKEERKKEERKQKRKGKQKKEKQ